MAPGLRQHDLTISCQLDQRRTLLERFLLNPMESIFLAAGANEKDSFVANRTSKHPKLDHEVVSHCRSQLFTLKDLIIW